MMVGESGCFNVRRSFACGSATMMMLLLVVLLIVTHHQVHGFSITHQHQQERRMNHNMIMTTIPKAVTKSQQPRRNVVLFGLMEDMMKEQQQEEEEGTTTKTSMTDDENNKYHQELFESLIFCSTGDIQKEILVKLEECSHPEFLQYLSKSIESSEDDEEKEGYQELLDWIKQAIATKQQRQQEEEELAQQQQIKIDDSATTEENDTTTGSTAVDIDIDDDGSKLSNTEVLKRANAIDQAVAQMSELSDDEKSSDFMSDCREVVNLSRSFNDRGQMRVGG